MGKLKKSNYKVIYGYIFNLLLFLPLFIYGKIHFSCDTYGIILEGLNSHALTFISSYRFFGALIIKIIELFGHDPIFNPVPDIILFILLASLSSTIVTYSLCSKLKDFNILTALSVNLPVVLSIENVWFCNLLSFPECIFLSGVGIFICTASIVTISHKQTITRCVISGILLICATAIYQQFIVVFLVYIIAFCSIDIVKNNKTDFKDLFLVYIKPAATALVSAIIYFFTAGFFVKLFNLSANERIGLSFENIITNIMYFASHQHSFLKGRGYFDTEILTVSFIVMGFLWFIALIAEWYKKRNTLKTFLLALSYFAAYICSYLLGLISTSHATRTMFGLFSIFALFAIGIISLSDKKIFKILIIAIMTVIIIANISKTYNEINQQIIYNNADIEYVENVYENILEYEAQTNKQVKYVACCYDNSKDIENGNDVYIDYSLRAMLSLKNVENGNNPFVFVEMPDKIYKDYFETKEMKEFNLSEQIVFDNETVYICIY